MTGRTGMAAGLLALVMMAWPAMAAPGLATPQAAVRAFYALYGTQSRKDALPDAARRQRYAPVLSPHLDALLARAEAARARFAARFKGPVPPMLGGDLFTSDFDGATGWTVGACTQDGAEARCSVALSHQGTGAKVTRWHDTLALVHGPDGWRVDDVIYDPAFAAGNTGSLRQMLQMMVAEAPP